MVRLLNALQALDCGEPICVYGDYDADGVTSTALLYSYLETIDANAMYYIPSRETEGYGMNKNAVDKLNERGIKLIITVVTELRPHRRLHTQAHSELIPLSQTTICPQVSCQRLVP